ncbi:hypothetical protein CfE428DRAFT_4209 [Chthoniobacter flavus Ellin428]|uniref:Uncharacterized protein n=1 Tax=Chthoniobacter flavus Ellin428 TaxID=497964 RepID=B4D5M0_9BACT|nr:hypothetical protein [Chthoniobacter flavus]EDY18425.1 hypothetical protein CfE428DRAFT_4209 [Chthoniobacter flavus Ellin428]TCO90866.1 hypothetical protein EV701_10915 [Chthoniobacter flavus]
MGDPLSESNLEALDAAPTTSSAVTLDDATIKASDLAQRGLTHYTTAWADDSIPDSPDAADVPNAPPDAQSNVTSPDASPSYASASSVTSPSNASPSAAAPGFALTLIDAPSDSGPDASPAPVDPADPVTAAQRDYQAARQAAGQSMLDTRQKLANLGFSVPDDALADPAALHTAVQVQINAALADPSANQLSPLGPARLTPHSQLLRDNLADLGNRAAAIVSDHADTLDDLRSSYRALSTSRPPTTEPPTAASPDQGSTSRPPTTEPLTAASPDQGSTSQSPMTDAQGQPTGAQPQPNAAQSQPGTGPSQPTATSPQADRAASVTPATTATPPSPAGAPVQPITGIPNFLWRTALTGAHTFEKSIEGALQWSKALPEWAGGIMPVAWALQKVANHTAALPALQHRTEQQEALLRGEPVVLDSGETVQLGEPSTATRIGSNLVGGLIGNAPGIALGGIPGLLTLGMQTAAQSSAEAHDQAKAAGASDSDAAKAGLVAALKTLPGTLLFAGAGGVTGKILKNIVPLEASPLARAAAAWVTGSGVNVAAGAAGKAAAGQNPTPTLDDLVNAVVFAGHGASTEYQSPQQLATARSILSGQHPQVAVLDGIAQGAGGRYTPEQQAQAAQYSHALRAVAADFLDKVRAGKGINDRAGAAAESPAVPGGPVAESGPGESNLSTPSGLTSQNPPAGLTSPGSLVRQGSTGSQSFRPSTPAAPEGQSFATPPAPETPGAPERPWGVSEADRGTPVESRNGITGTLGDANSQKAAVRDASGNYHLFDAADVRPAAPDVPRESGEKSNIPANPNPPPNPGPWGEVTDDHRGLPVETQDGRTGTLAAGPLPNTPNPNIVLRDAAGTLHVVPQAETRLAGSAGDDAPSPEGGATATGTPAAPPNPGPWGEVTDDHRGLPVETQDGLTGTLAAGPPPGSPNGNVAIRDAAGKLHVKPQAETRLAGSPGDDAPPPESGAPAPGANFTTPEAGTPDVPDETATNSDEGDESGIAAHTTFYTHPLDPVTPPEPGKGIVAEPNRATVEEAEVINEPLEHGTVYLPDGSVLMRKPGKIKDQVPFKKKEIPLLKDNIFTHNHPCGNSFSEGDLDFAAKADLGEIRIVCPTPKGGAVLFRLQRPAKGWLPAEEMTSAYKAAMSKVRNRQFAERAANKVGKKQSSQIFAHEIMNELQKEFPEDILYSRTDL